MFSEKLPEMENYLRPQGIRSSLEEAGGGYRGLLAATLGKVAEVREKEIWGDSSPQDLLYIDRILEWYPEARIVGLVRDPRGFLSSYKNHDKRAARLGEAEMKRYNLLSSALLWQSYMNALLEGKRQPRGDAIFLLRYEDLVTDPEPWVRKLTQHLGVEYDPAMIQVEHSNTSYEEGAAAPRGITPRSRDRWRTELTPTEIWLAQRLVGGTMAKFGYEPLAGVHPSPVSLSRTLVQIPVWLVRFLTRGEKPLTLGRIRRVLSLGLRR